MKLGFAKIDITPRVGVELQGYGAYLNRHSDGVRDPLFARAMAVEVDGDRAVLISLDLIGVSPAVTATVRDLLQASEGLPAAAVLLHAIHTHSGPAMRVYSGWGDPDAPYLEILPYRIAAAAGRALAALQEAVLLQAEVPCEGIATNREYDLYRVENIDEAFAADWRPPKPETTDTTCRVIKAEADGKCIGFASYYGCHPVVGGPRTHKIHGDYAGIATNLLETANDNAVGLFFQGAQGDINSCVICPEDADALRALDVIAPRYAAAVQRGLDAAEPVDVDVLRTAVVQRRFSRQPWGRDKLEELLAEQSACLHAAAATDADPQTRLAMVRVSALRDLLARLDAGEDLSPPVALHGIRIGPIAFLGSPFEVFRAIKNDVADAAQSAIPLVLGFTDDSIGYAPDRTCAARGGYAADMVPLICRQLPYANIHDELRDGLLELDAALNC